MNSPVHQPLHDLFYWCEEFQDLVSQQRKTLAQYDDWSELSVATGETELPYPWEREAGKLVELLGQFYGVWTRAQNYLSGLNPELASTKLWSELVIYSRELIDRLSPAWEWNDAAVRLIESRPDALRRRFKLVLGRIVEGDVSCGFDDVLDPLRQGAVRRFVEESFRGQGTQEPSSSTATETTGTEADLTPNASESGDGRKRRRMSCEQVIDSARKYLVTDRKPWPGRNQLAATLGCSRPTLDKACKRDAQLAKIRLEFEQAQEGHQKSVPARQMPGAVQDSIAARMEADEIDLEMRTLSAHQSDALIDRLKAECVTPDAEKWFAGLTEDERLRVAIQKCSDPDTGRDTRHRGGRVRTQ